MIYPFIDDEDIPEDEGISIPREYEINYETGQLTGRVVEGIDAVKVWVWSALQTAKSRYYIYSMDFGQELDELIGLSYTPGYIESEFERMVTDCLTQSEYIDGITDFTFEVDKDGDINASFTLQTIFGEEGVEVRGDDIRVDYGSNDG